MTQPARAGRTGFRFAFACLRSIRGRAPRVRCRANGRRRAPKAPKIRVGFNNNAVNYGTVTADQAARLIAKSGGTVDRVAVNWGQIEPSKREFHLSPDDAIYKADLARGVRPLFIFVGSPGWANGGLCPTGCFAPPLPFHYDDAANTAAMLAKRYPKAAGIEIWNEPNTPYFWSPVPNPSAYTTLSRTATARSRQPSRHMKVAGGSMANGPGTSLGKISGPEFLAQMYTDGAAGFMNAISMHAYPSPSPASSVGTVHEIRHIRNTKGKRSTPIWVTETGVTTTGPAGVSQGRQASLLESIDHKLRKRSGASMVLINTLIEPPRGPKDPETGFGVVTSKLHKRPAYCALAASWGQGKAC